MNVEEYIMLIILVSICGFMGYKIHELISKANEK